MNNLKEKLVSVLIPAYNVEKFLSRCVTSVLNQKKISLSDIEILIANDGSTDETLVVAKKLQIANPSTITVFDNLNIGVGKTRQFLFENAIGKYIVFIDSDDYIDEDYLFKLLEKMTANDCDIVVCGYRRENDSKEVVFEKKLKNNTHAKYTSFPNHCKLYKKEVLEKVPVDTYSYIGIGEDLLHSLLVYEYFKDVEVVDNYTGYIYYVNENSLTNNKENSSLKTGKEEFQKMMIDGYTLIEEIFKASPPNTEKALFALKLYLSDYLNYSYQPFEEKEQWFKEIKEKFPIFLGNIYSPSTLLEIQQLEEENAKLVQDTLEKVISGNGELLYDENRTPVYL